MNTALTVFLVVAGTVLVVYMLAIIVTICILAWDARR